MRCFTEASLSTVTSNPSAEPLPGTGPPAAEFGQVWRTGPDWSSSIRKMLISSLAVVMQCGFLPCPVWLRWVPPGKEKKRIIFHALEKLKWPGSLPKQGSALCPPTSLFEIAVIGIYQPLQHTQQVQGKADGKVVSIFWISVVLMLPCWPVLPQIGTVHSTYWWWMMLSSEDQILLNHFGIWPTPPMMSLKKW